MRDGSFFLPEMKRYVWDVEHLPAVDQREMQR